MFFLSQEYEDLLGYFQQLIRVCLQKHQRGECLQLTSAACLLKILAKVSDVKTTSPCANAAVQDGIGLAVSVQRCS